MKLALTVAVVVVAALLLAACERRSPYHVPTSTEPYVRWEAPGMFGASTGERNMYWLDDERLLYVGRDEEDDRFERTTLRIWTPATGKVEELGPAKGGLCYFRGFVTYVESIKGIVYAAREGQLGGRLEFVPDELERYKVLSKQGFRKHQLNCRYFQSKDLAPGEHCKVPLLPGDGYLEVAGGRCEEENQERLTALNRRERGNEQARIEWERFTVELARRPVMYFPAAGPPMALPMEANEFMSTGPRVEYVEWKRRYQFQQLRGKGQPTHGGGIWPADQPNLVYLFAPSGDVQWEAIPVRDNFSKKPDRVAVTRSGIVAMMMGETIDRLQSARGIVLYANGKPQILDDGWTQQLALSPGGCRIAYTRQVGDGTARSPVELRVRVIDLCSRTR